MQIIVLGTNPGMVQTRYKYPIRRTGVKVGLPEIETHVLCAPVALLSSNQSDIVGNTRASEVELLSVSVSGCLGNLYIITQKWVVVSDLFLVVVVTKIPSAGGTLFRCSFKIAAALILWWSD